MNMLQEIFGKAIIDFLHGKYAVILTRKTNTDLSIMSVILVHLVNITM